MEKEFIPFELAVKLKELGFDEKCLGYYIKNSSLWCNWLDVKFNDDPSNDKEDFVADAPLYQQAFRWFREKQAIEGFIYKSIEGTYYFVIKKLGNNENNMYEFITNAPKNVDTYEEAELACLDKLIEIVKTKSE